MQGGNRKGCGTWPHDVSGARSIEGLFAGMTQDQDHRAKSAAGRGRLSQDESRARVRVDGESCVYLHSTVFGTARC